MPQVGIPSCMYGYAGDVAFDDVLCSSVKIGLNATVEGADFLVSRQYVTEAGWHAFRDETIQATAGGQGYASFDAQSEMSGAGPYNHFVGFQSRPAYTAAGNLTSYLAAFDTYVSHTGAGTVAACYGLLVRDPAGAGPITLNYGVYIEEMTRGATDYSIYCAGATARIATSFITQRTADGADSSYLGLCGGGAEGIARGGTINLFGNENALKGSIAYLAGMGDGATYGDHIFYGSAGPTEIMRIKGTVPTIYVNLAAIQVFGGNAAAAAGGLAVGDIYRTGGDPSYLAIRSV